MLYRLKQTVLILQRETLMDTVCRGHKANPTTRGQMLPLSHGEHCNYKAYTTRSLTLMQRNCTAVCCILS